MATVLRGKIRSGSIVPDEPVNMPDGEEVTVQVSPIGSAGSGAPAPESVVEPTGQTDELSGISDVVLKQSHDRLYRHTASMGPAAALTNEQMDASLAQEYSGTLSNGSKDPAG